MAVTRSTFRKTESPQKACLNIVRTRTAWLSQLTRLPCLALTPILSPSFPDLQSWPVSGTRQSSPVTSSQPTRLQAP